MSETKQATTPAAPKMRANSVSTYQLIEGQHEWTFPGIGKIVVKPESGSMEARHFALNYGIRQWIADGGAVSAGADGKIDPKEKFAGMQERAELWNSGATDLRRKASGGGGVVSWVTRALVALGTFKGNDVSTPEKANAYVKMVAEHPKLGFNGQMAKARTFIEKAADVAAKIEELRAAELPSDVDPDAFLDEMNATE